MEHLEPSRMERASSVIFPGYASFPSPAAIFFSQSATILVPTRQGKHLPQDSCCTASAYFAHMSTMSTSSSRSTMPSQPMRALIRSPGQNSAASFTFAGGLLSGAAASLPSNRSFCQELKMMSVIVILSVDLPQHNVDAADRGDDIGDH